MTVKLKLKEIEINNFKGITNVKAENLGSINAFIGKNNSGKSSILHAIDMAGLALTINNWNNFQPKLSIKDLIANTGDFSINLKYEDDTSISIKSNSRHGPVKSPQPNPENIFKSVLVLPDVGYGMTNRRHKTPKQVIQQIESRNYSEVNSLETLYAIKYYSLRNERGLTEEDYQILIDEIVDFFPEITNVESDRTEDDIATLTYVENEIKLDILYSGSGLKHFVDVLLKITISNANIVLLDEPEMGLHPDLQRRFIEYLVRLTEKKNLQIFMATHSQVLLNYADVVSYYRVTRNEDERDIVEVPEDMIETVLSDLGIRPSDIFNSDIVLMVEGATEVVFFEFIIRELYSDVFDKVAISILQYGGSAAEGIISGSISISNITSAQKYVYWIRDRDAAFDENPSSESKKFKNKIEQQGFKCHIWDKREIEFYFPEEILVGAQQGDSQKITDVKQIYHGDQKQKFRKEASRFNICVPQGVYLRRLLRENIHTKTQINDEVINIIEDILIPWKEEIIG